MSSPNYKTIINQALLLVIKNLYPDCKDFAYNIDDPSEITFAEISSDLSKGDFTTNIAFQLSKPLRKPPFEVAKEVSEELNKFNEYALKFPKKDFEDLDNEILKIITGHHFLTEPVSPGFINFIIKTSAFFYAVADAIMQKENYGKSFINSEYITNHEDKNGKQIPKKVLIEHTSPNPNKEMHIGHLKNNLTGITISNLIKMRGGEVYNDMINNNRGIAIAKLMWGYLKFGRINETTPVDLNYWFENQDKWHTPESKAMFPGKFVDELYVLGANDCKENDESEKIVRQFVIDWENEEPKNRAIWQLTQDWVWQGYKVVLDRINGWKFDHIWNESDHYQKGKDLVQKGLEVGALKRLEDGAVVTDLKDFKLTDTIVLKKDGTSLYMTQDLALTKLKKEKFNADVMMWVIGPEQSLQMKQMFAVCSQLGIGKYEDFKHIPYGFILVKKSDGSVGKASSREGAYHVMDLLDNMKAKILGYVKAEFDAVERDKIAEKLAIASVKYALLKVNRTQDMVFDIDSSISIEGDSAPYILYSLVRAKSLLSNVNDFSNDEVEMFLFTLKAISPYEKDLSWQIALFSDAVTTATTSLNPAIVCNYAYALATTFNKFYAHCPILTASEEEKNRRLTLTKAFEITMQNTLRILNIDWVERM
jgi:arginyl-tRNA synthetase